MTCQEARDRLHEQRRGRAAPAPAEEARLHLEGCAACRRAEEAEALLDHLLTEKVPRRPASPALRRRLEAMARQAAAPRPAAAGASRRWTRALLPAAAAGLLAASGALLLSSRAARQAESLDRVVGEAVGDHLRTVTALHPWEVESSDTHQVKPWFTGRLDFAPTVPGDEGDLRLLGGAVGWFLERKAAVVSYRIRQHAVTLLVFPAEGLSWAGGGRSLGPVPGWEATRRGIHAVLWRQGGLGHALVSDVDREELWRTAARFAAAERERPVTP